MARLVATASLAVLLLSLLAVATCRTLEAPEHDNAVAVAVSDEHGQPNPADDEHGPPNPADEDGNADVIPAVAVGEGFLWLPSHRCHGGRPCSHGQGFHRRGASRRVHPGPGAVVVPTEPDAEVKAVAEPDSDSRPDTDGEQAEAAVVEEEANKPFHGEEEHNEGMVKAWKSEMLRRRPPPPPRRGEEEHNEEMVKAWKSEMLRRRPPPPPRRGEEEHNEGMVKTWKREVLRRRTPPPPRRG